MEQNELALSFYNAGFFNYQLKDQALACLSMMDFNKKNEVMEKISENGTLMEMMVMYQQLALSLASQISPEMAEQVGQMILGQGGQPVPQAIGAEADTDLSTEKEHPYVEKARGEARASTQAD